jgi:hypothetical protein
VHISASPPHPTSARLSTSAAVLVAPGRQWRQTVRQQIVELDEVIAQAQAAQNFLTHALNCPTDHPARECPTMIAALDRSSMGRRSSNSLPSTGATISATMHRRVREEIRSA